MKTISILEYILFFMDIIHNILSEVAFALT